MIEAFINFAQQIITAAISTSGYAGIAFFMFLESCGIPFPSEIIMPFSGFLVFRGEMNFWLVALIGAFGNLAGSLLAYWIGARGGRPLIERWGKYFFISKRELDIADRWFSSRGEAIVFFGRLLPVIRTYISFPAGISKMNISKFILYTLLGCIPWCILFTWLGVKLADNWELIRTKLHNLDMAIAILVILAIVYYIIRHIRKR